ncbi:hypothetical protein [Nonlabens tegetincola]|uniref:hypothetical protein n=1 Tax=Nonlabens tegetincola TaxID=323273 RepID=UPI000CF3CDF2|nr:hypothetical protein [Nonlabens tegetincola]PQJ18448.1 hypothetical protein BST93_08150 [Nonlabens tegetincola]
MEKLDEKFEVIHYYDNIYLVIEHKKTIEYDLNFKGAHELAKKEMNKWITCIKSKSLYHYRKKDDTLLYAGRVRIGSVGGRTWKKLFVDGIKIIILDGRSEPDRMDYQWICNYLNAIETYGVDAFMDNYKKSLQEYSQRITMNIEANQSLLEKISNKSMKEKIQFEIIRNRSILNKILNIILLINVHMNLAIENDIAKITYDKISNLFA